MTNDEINRAVAEAKGWVEGRVHACDRKVWLRDTSGDDWIAFPDWDPAEDMNQAVGLLEGDGVHAQLTYNADTKCWTADTLRAERSVDFTLPRALCLAWLKAKGVSDDG